MNDTLQLKPRIEAEAACHACGARLAPQGLLWQGIHVCAAYRCDRCGAEFHEDLPVGHSANFRCRIDAGQRLLGDIDPSAQWYSEPLRRSLQAPDAAAVGFEVRVRRSAPKAVVLNCIDFLYGHCLLKLLNAPRHLRDPDWGLVVIVPRALEWLVPREAAEVWVVDLPLGRTVGYFPELHRRIAAELARFPEARLSRAFMHLPEWEPVLFTGVPRHDFAAPSYRVTFVWRDDRLWLPGWAARIGARFPASLRLARQRARVIAALEHLRRAIPEARPTVAGIGRDGGFPAWIDDRRIAQGGEAAAERALCVVYAESRLVVGVHGSNMLLPTGHAGMSIDLMPELRWANIAQDVLFAGSGVADADLRLSAFRHRFIDIAANPRLVASIATGMLKYHARMARNFVAGSA